MSGDSLPSESDVVIVGAGAAGLATAIFIARRNPGVRVTLLDGARRVGAKILVSGGGRCNVTNRSVSAGDFWGGDRRAINSVLSTFPVPATIAFFEEMGVPLHEEERGKLFPDSNSARTVLDALLAEASRLDVSLLPGRRVTEVRRPRPCDPPDENEPADPRARRSEAGVGPGVEDAGCRFEVETGEGAIRCRVVVLATGGRSLPKTGSDGAGLDIAASLGHKVVEATPALAPLVLDGSFHVPLAGVSHDAELSIEADGRVTARLRGPMLWTHFGVSGPAALDASRHWHRAHLEGRMVRVRLSFVPGLDDRAVEQALLAAGKSGTASLRGALALGEPSKGQGRRGALSEPSKGASRRVPTSVADAVLAALGVDGDVRLAQLSRDVRRRVARALTAWDLPVTGSRGYNYAEATAGGVALGEVDRGTMGSRVCRGLYLVGEILDVDGRLGGFNFQWAWSSAWVAARGVVTELTAHS